MTALEASLRESLAAQIFLIRDELNLSQRAFGELAGMHQSRIAQLEDKEWENAPSLTTLVRIANAIGCGIQIRFIADENTCWKPTKEHLERIREGFQLPF